MQEPVTLVLGASPFPGRYAHMAVRALRRHGHAVLAVGIRPGMIVDVPIVADIPGDAQVDTVTMYLNAHNQEAWQERVLALRPRRIIFNPGAEHEALERLATAQGIDVMHACTLVMLSAGTY